MMQNPFNRPYAKGNVDIACWLNSRPDGSQYLAIELGPFGRYTAEVNPGSTSNNAHYGVPYASAKGIRVWKHVTHGPDGDHTHFQVKCQRFPGSFRVYLQQPAAPPRAAPRASFAREAARVG